MKPTVSQRPHGADAAAPACGARFIDLPVVSDEAGELLWAQVGTHLPFEARRMFCIHGVPAGQVRGRHAHRRLHQVLVCLRGQCVVTLDDGTQRDRVVLDVPHRALYVPPLVWATQREFSADALLVVLASEVYRPDDYIRDYDEFVALRRG